MKRSSDPQLTEDLQHLQLTEDSQSLQFEDLPHEILCKIFSFLYPGDLCHLSMTCKSLKPIADDDINWRRHISLYLPPAKTGEPKKPQCLKEIYLTDPHRLKKRKIIIVYQTNNLSSEEKERHDQHLRDLIDFLLGANPTLIIIPIPYEQESLTFQQRLSEDRQLKYEYGVLLKQENYSGYHCLIMAPENDSVKKLDRSDLFSKISDKRTMAAGEKRVFTIIPVFWERHNKKYLPSTVEFLMGVRFGVNPEDIDAPGIDGLLYSLGLKLEKEDRSSTQSRQTQAGHGRSSFFSSPKKEKEGRPTASSSPATRARSTTRCQIS